MYSSFRDVPHLLIAVIVCDMLVLSIVLLVHVLFFSCSVLFSVITLAIGSNFVMPIKHLKERERGSVSTPLARFSVPQTDSAEHEEQMKVIYLRPQS